MKLLFIFPLFLLIALSNFAQAANKKGLVLTCNSADLPALSEVATFETTDDYKHGVLLSSLEDIGSTVIITGNGPEVGGGFVDPSRSSGDTKEAKISKPKYLATIWSPAKDEIWCAVYQGIIAEQHECQKIAGKYNRCD